MHANKVIYCTTNLFHILLTQYKKRFTGVELRSDVHFDGNGYLEFSRSLLSHENEDESEVIAMELSTNSSDGLIFWHGQRSSEDGQGQDYIALASNALLYNC